MQIRTIPGTDGDTVGDAKTTGLAVARCDGGRRKHAENGPKHATPLAVRRVAVVTVGRLVALLALGLTAACTTPTLPLPPPTEPSVTASSVPGKFHLHGVQSATPNALIIAYNQNPAVPRADRVTGTQADDAGSWDMDVTASPKDVISITQETGDTRSPSIEVTIPSPK